MAFFISGGSVSTHCSAAERSFAKFRNGLVEFHENRAAHARLQTRRALILGRSGLHGGHGAAHADLDMVTPALLATTTTVYIHDDLMGAEFEFCDLHLVAGVDRRAMIGDRAIQ